MNPQKIPVAVERVLARYERSGLAAPENEKVMCSQVTWESRLNYVIREIISLTKSDQITWLDVGCGSGKLFELAQSSGLRDTCTYFLGVDATESLLDLASAKSWAPGLNVQFMKRILGVDSPLATQCFDVVTAIGLVYFCGRSPEKAIADLLALVCPKGYLIVTLENPEWVAARKEADHQYVSTLELNAIFGRLLSQDLIFDYRMILLNTEPVAYETFSETSKPDAYKEVVLVVTAHSQRP